MKSLSTKAITSLFLVFSIVLFSGCKKLNPKKELRIDLGTGFNNDNVVIKLDDEVVFSGNTSTTLSLGLAKIIELNKATGKYELSVTVNGIEKKDNFKHKKDRYIYISLDDSTSVINISYPDEMYFYD